MKYRIILFFLVTYVASSKNASAQTFNLHQSSAGAEIVINEKDTLENPWAGGMMNPQFSNLDFNNDGRQDIFVFEPADGKISLFESFRNGTFRYLPQFETSFPKLVNWALLADYNKDGKADIFTYSTLSAGLDIYKNVSTGNKIAFIKVAEKLQYQDEEYRSNLYAPATDIPAIVDMDNDGDLDILSYDVLQYHIQYYKNLSMEKYGKPDSLDFKIADRCWGKFAESFKDNNAVLGENCGTVGKREKKHGGSALLAFDSDDDGDKDLLLGDLLYDNLILLENGRIKSGSVFTRSDSIIFVDTIFPRNTKKAQVSTFPAAFLVDINADNIQDLIVSPQAQFESKTNNQILTYINNGTPNKPKFDFLRDDFLQNTMFDGGERSAPAFVDYNNDSLMDLVVSVKGNAGNNYQYCKLHLYKNIGSRTKAVYKLVNDDLGNISQEKMAALSPNFKDMNGDTKPDLILGNEEGEVLFFYNQGLDANQIPTFTEANIPSIDVGQYSKPAAADLDRDNLADLVIGEQSGNFNYYKNTGTSTLPVFTFVTDTFGGIITNHFYYEYEYNDSGKVIDSTRVREPNGASAPEISDMDGDGKWDLVSGTIYGEIFICYNIEDSLNATFHPDFNIIYNTFTDKNEAKDFGYVTTPAAADINGDGKAEVFLGNYKGGLYYFASQPVILSIGEKLRIAKPNLHVYPNPASKNLYIQVPENALIGQYNLFISNILGQITYKQTVKNASAQNININVSNFTSGMYFVTLKDQAGNHFSAKVYME